MKSVPARGCIQRSVIVLCGILASSSSAAIRADESETLKKRFVEEAPPAWKEYAAYAGRLQGTTETTATVNGKVRLSVRGEFKSNSRCKMVLTQSLLAGDASGEALAVNPLYGFNLTRKGNNASWILSDLQMGSFRGGPKGWDDFPMLRLCISVQLYELAELIRLPQFTVVHASTVQQGGIELCQIKFVSKQTDGALLLDPNRFWTVHHSTIRDRSSPQGEVIVAKQDIELRDPVARFPIPKRWLLDKEITSPKETKSEARVVREFDLKEPSHPPDDREFTLSAFDLPEPVGFKQPASSRTWLWLLAVALGLGLLALVFARLKSRHAVTSQPKTQSPLNRGLT